MSKIQINHLKKIFPPNVIAVDDINLTIESGEILTLLGPSGCGKTTVLRCIAGLENLDKGEILIDGKILSSPQDSVPPEKRNIGMVFQSYALWPNKTVFKNVSYSLELKRIPKHEIKTRVLKTLDHLNLTPLIDRYPAHLSGGQQQRVALARSLVTEPAVLLFDEPLSNLDAKLRERLRKELRSILKEVGITTIYVTHDQAEAMVISDRIVIINQGNIVQQGEPEDLYKRPDNRFVAEFVGKGTFLNGKIKKSGEEFFTIAVDGLEEIACSQKIPACDDVIVVLRPELLSITSSDNYRESGVNQWLGKITGRIYEGSRIAYDVDIKEKIQVETTKSDFTINDRVAISIDPNNVICIPNTGELHD